MLDADEIWVIDTSSINQVRRAIFPVSSREAVFNALTEIIRGGQLVFPTQVFDELHRFKNKHKIDHPYEWAKKNKHAAKQYEPLFSDVQEILANSQLSKVLDPEKDHEEADPYVLALACKLSLAGRVGVLTEDRKSKPTKLSFADACGLRRIVTLTIEPFLAQQKIWPV